MYSLGDRSVQHISEDHRRLQPIKMGFLLSGRTCGMPNDCCRWCGLERITGWAAGVWGLGFNGQNSDQLGEICWDDFHEIRFRRMIFFFWPLRPGWFFCDTFLWPWLIIPRQAQHNVIQQSEIAASHGFKPSSLMEKGHADLAAWQRGQDLPIGWDTTGCALTHNTHNYTM